MSDNKEKSDELYYVEGESEPVRMYSVEEHKLKSGILAATILDPDCELPPEKLAEVFEIPLETAKKIYEDKKKSRG